MAWTGKTFIMRDEQGNTWELDRQTKWGGGAKSWKIYVTKQGSNESLLYHESHIDHDSAQGVVDAAIGVINAGTGSQSANIDLSPQQDAPGEQPGLPSMTQEKWFGMNEDDKVQYIIDTRYNGDLSGPNGVLGDHDDIHPADIKALLKSQPLPEGVDPTKAKFQAEAHGGDLPEGVRSELDTDNDGKISFEESTSGQTSALTYGAAGRTYRTAGITKDTMLSGLQEEASAFTPAASTGVGMRGKIAGMGGMKKKFETGTDIYNIAGDTYEAAGDAYGLSETKAGLSYESGMYDLDLASQGAWESDFKGFWQQLPDAGGN